MEKQDKGFKKKKTILVVEDSRTQAEMLRHVLESNGFDALLADCGKKALAVFKETKPDCVISDIVMPDMQGYELCKRLKSEEGGANIPVILLTALANTEDVVQGLACGADSYITKPYSEKYLLARIEKLLAEEITDPGMLQPVSLEVEIEGRKRLVKIDYQRMLNLLTSTYEAAVFRNGELLEAQDSLKYAKENLENLVEKRTEELRLAEESYKALTENSPDLIARFDSEVRHLYVNPAAAKAGPFPARAYVGKSLRDCGVPEEKILKLEKIIRSCFETGQPAELEDDFETPDGKRFFLTKFVPERLFDGTTRSVISFARDITEHKREERYGEMAREILKILNRPEDLKDSANSILKELKAGTGADAAGIRLRSGNDYPYLVQEGFPEDFLLTENTLLAHDTQGGLCRNKDGQLCLECTCGLVISGKKNAVLTKGGTFWTNDSAPLLLLPPEQDPRLQPRNNCIHKGYSSVGLVPIREKGAVVGLMQLNFKKKGMFTAGAIEQLESIAAHIGEALMRKGSENERAQMQEQLLQAQKMESVGRLAGGIAHDFNNLLTAIGAYAGLIEKGLGKESPMLGDVKEIQTAAERAAGLTRQLLAFSRKQMLAPQVIDINTSVGGMVKMLQRLIGEDIKLETRLAPQECRVKVDPGQMDQLLVNLAVNSRDAMPKGGTLSIETAVFDPAADFFAQYPDLPRGPIVSLGITDTGTGMSDQVKEHVFEPFFTTKEKGKGTGLGLSTVFGIVKQSGGEIGVKSEAGSGTSFRVYFPSIEQNLTEKNKMKAGNKTGDGKSKGKESVLFVEDEDSLRRLGERVLLMNGYEVTCAANGEQALAAAESRGRPFDLLVTDVVMPGMSGKELAGKLQEKALVKRTLYMSGYTDDAIVKHGVLEEGIAFIYKPFAVDALTAKLREVLDGGAEQAKA